MWQQSKDNEVCCVCFVFFFQAEDGIRDLVRSRGLGDVYKRQDHEQVEALRRRLAAMERDAQLMRNRRGAYCPIATVSYTHLTLPTIYSV